MPPQWPYATKSCARPPRKPKRVAPKTVPVVRHPIMRKMIESPVPDSNRVPVNHKALGSKTTDQAIVSDLLSNNPGKILKAAKRIRSFLEGITYKKIAESGDILTATMPRMIELLDPACPVDFQVEAIAVTRRFISLSGSDPQKIRQLVEWKALPIFKQALEQIAINEEDNSYPGAKEYIIDVIGSIASCDAYCRDQLLLEGVFQALVEICESHIHDSNFISRIFIESAVSTLLRICQMVPVPPFEKVKGAVNIFFRIISEQYDFDLYYDACTGIALLGLGSGEETLQKVKDTEFIPVLIGFLRRHNQQLVSTALKVVCNISSENDAVNQLLLDAGVLETLKDICTNPKRTSKSHRESLFEDAFRTVANVTSGTSGHIQDVIDAEMIPFLTMVMESGDPGAKKTAAWAVVCALRNANQEQTRLISTHTVLQLMAKAITQHFPFPF